MAEKGAVSWTVVEQLIDLYEGFPCLYNIKDSEYHDRNKKNRAFAEIATTLGLTGMYLLVLKSKRIIKNRVPSGIHYTINIIIIMTEQTHFI